MLSAQVENRSRPTTRRTILLVEDEWLVREPLAAELRRAGCDVLESDNGEEAIALARMGRHIDVLVTDIQLAGSLSGWEVAAAFREFDPGLPVIYASANAGDDARRVEASRFFAKPCAPEAILKVCCEVAAPGD